MQVRYADTPAQKELKRVTAERRQFRTNEYNIGAYGTADVGIHPSIYSQAPWSRRAGPGSTMYVTVPSLRIQSSNKTLGPMFMLLAVRAASPTQSVLPSSMIAAPRRASAASLRILTNRFLQAEHHGTALG